MPRNNSKTNETTQDSSSSDWFDGVCETATDSMCPVPTNLDKAMAAPDQHEPDVLDHVFERSMTYPTESQPENDDGKDALDYVFEKVESMICHVNGDVEVGDATSIVEEPSKPSPTATASTRSFSSQQQELVITPYDESLEERWYSKRSFHACVCLCCVILIGLIVVLVRVVV